MNFFQSLTLSENKTVAEINKLQEKYWASFLNKSFPSISSTDAPNLNSFDWIILLNQADPLLFTGAYALNEQCKKLNNMTCFEIFMDPEVGKNTMAAIYEVVAYVESFISMADFTAGFNVAFSSLWHSKLPCFDTQGISALTEGERGILKQCKWKGIQVPCSGIFTTFPTDRGMCCSFNIKAAEDIFSESQFSALVKQLQADDYNTSFENSILPDWYNQNNEPTAQPGINMGLEVILDAHSNVVESFSINNDFEGFTGLITDPGDFPLTNLRGFNIKAGHYNLVAISAVSITGDDDFENLKPASRKCRYPDEIGTLKLFKNYSQANCFLECSLNYAQKNVQAEQNLTQACTPWFFPFIDNAFKMCGPFQRISIIENMKKASSEDCSYCWPDCIRTVYDQKVTTQPFRQCDERNMYLTEFCTLDIENGIHPLIWAKQVIENFKATKGKVPSYLSNLETSKRIIKESSVLPKFFEGMPKEYDAYEKDIAVLKVFFDSSTVMQYQSQPRQSWTDYFAAVGGALGLCIGLSIMTVIELIWLCIRMCGLCKKKEEDPNEVKDFAGN